MAVNARLTMSEQAQLTCVSCDTDFDPEPNGGFCPDCDTPHPDYGVEDDAADADDAGADAGEPDVEEADDADEADAAADDAVAAAGSYCPECGADLDPDARADEAESDLAACPDCGRSITDESYCPDCGRDLDEVRDQQAEAGEEDADEGTPTPAPDDADAEAEEADDDVAADDGAAAADDDVAADDAAGEVDAIGLVINGTRYDFADGDTFGRRDEDWLEDLVAAAGGSDDVAYVSGEHLAFSVENGNAFVVDVSRNGTALNGTDLDGGKAEVEDGDELVLAERAEVEIEL